MNIDGRAAVRGMDERKRLLSIMIVELEAADYGNTNEFRDGTDFRLSSTLEHI